MGGKLSSVSVTSLSAEQQKQLEQCDALTQEVVNVFTKYFPKAINSAVLRKVKGESTVNSSGANEIPPTIIYHGTCEKKGLLNSQYKSRTLVALNKVDNYCLEYYEKDIRKGSIQLHGYFVSLPQLQKMDKDGRFTLSLVPYSSLQRTWNLAFATSKERDSWIKILKYSCRKSKPIVDNNEFVANAFDRTINYIISKYGCRHQSFLSYGTEKERLVAYVYDLIEFQILENCLKSTTKPLADNVRAQVMTSIQGNIDKTWSNILDRLRSSLKMTEINIRKMSTNINLYEAKAKEYIISLIKDDFNTLLAQIRPIYVDPFLSLLASPLSHIFEKLTQVFGNELRNIYSNIKDNPSKGVIVFLVSRVDKWEIDSVYQVIYDSIFSFYSNELSRFESTLKRLKNVEVDAIYEKLMTSIKDIIFQRLFLIQPEEVKLLKSEPTEKSESVIETILTQFTCDIKRSYKGIVYNILTYILQGLVTDELSSKCYSKIETIVNRKLDDIISEPGCRPLFDCAELYEESLIDALMGSYPTMMSNFEKIIEAKL